MASNLPETIGRYEILGRLGHGGMGVVYRARDPQIGRSVAIKLLRVNDEGLRDRFLREARSAGSLKHRNIVTIHDIGEHQGQPYIVMEFVEGVTLAEIIRNGVELSVARKLEIIESLAAGLDYAHNNGIVHRDMKPANVMIDRDDVLKILDFGIARVAGSGLTQIGTMLGTPNYMSPEQVQERPVDRRSDIFAVGLVFYEILCYRQAFSGDTMHSVLTAIVRETPVPLHEVYPGIDPAIEAIIDRAIQKDPSERYQTLAGLTADLKRAQGRARGLRTIASPDALTLDLVRPSPTPTPSGDLAKRRAERIERLLPNARRAYESGDFASSIDVCEQVLLLDPDEPRALDLLEQAQRSLARRQIEELVRQAKAAIGRDDLDDADQLVERALALDFIVERGFGRS